MRVDFVTTFGLVAGFPSFPEATLARALTADGHRVRALTYYAKSVGMIRDHHATIDGTAVHRLRRVGVFAPGVVGRVVGWPRPDVAHVHHLSNRLSALALPTYAARRVPTVFSPYGILHDPVLVPDTDRPFAARIRTERVSPSPWRSMAANGVQAGAFIWALHRPLFAADAVHAMSQHERQFLIRELGVPEERVHFIPLGIDAALLDTPEPVARSVAPTVLFLGQVKVRKGWDILVRAIPHVLRVVPDARFVFAGHTGRDSAAFDALVGDLGVRGAIDLLGRVDEAEKVRALRSATVLTLPERYAGFGLPLVEAMTVGTPVVTTNVPSCNEIVRDGETGLLVPPDDPPALAAGIVRLLQDAELRERLARAAAVDARTRYSSGAMARSMAALYASLIEAFHLRTSPAPPAHGAGDAMGGR